MADKKTDPRTVFVRGIDASVTDSQLQEFFSDVGPVKNAFLVRRGKDGPHKGFGFVQFAVQEDAVRAAAQLNGKDLEGRKLKVEGAVKRAPLEERKKRKQDAAAAPPAEQQAEAGAPAADKPPAAKKPRPAKPAPKPAGQGEAASGAEGKHKWLRTVAVGGLTAEAVGSAVQLARAAGEVEEVIQPVPEPLAKQFMLRRDGCTGESFLAVYKSVKGALQAVAKLHGQTVTAGGSQQQAAGKKGRNKAAGGAEAQGGGTACRVWARQLSGEGLHQKRWRLIVRNLPFTATEAQLQEAFTPAGFVWELTLPRSASGRGRGFAFVGFTCRAHAERGIKLVNGQPVAGRPVAVDWAVGKAQYDSQQQQEGGGVEGVAAAAAKGEAEGPGLDSDLESGSSDEEDGPGSKLGHEEEDGDGDGDGGAALAPEQERRMLSSVIDGILDSGSEGEEESEEEEESEDEEEGSEEEEDESDSEGEEEEEGSEEEEEEGGSEGEPAEAGAPAADPFSRKQLQQKSAAAAAAAAGGSADAQRPQRAEPEEGATVFIRGLPLDVSKEQVFLKMKAYGPVRSCRLVVDKASGKLKGTAFVDFYKRASAEAAAEACAKGRRKEGPGVVIAGRVADVDLALGHDDVRALAVQKAAGRSTASKRMELAKEGQIAEGSPAWEDMSAGDRAKRKRAAEEKKLKLRSPNFVVSDTRLSVRNIPLSWTEKQLKQAFIEAVKERASKAQPHVKQAKILLDDERTGPDGTPRSKGIGFVEFSEHEHALCALRQLNNNPKVFSKDKRPIVEFALENVKALKLREAKLAKSKQPRQQQEQQEAEPGAQKQQPAQPQAGAAGSRGEQQREDGEGGEGVAAPEKSKRALRKERRLMLKERRQQQRQEAREKGGSSGGGGDGDVDGAAPAANGAAAAGGKSKAAKRREQRKRQQGSQVGTAAAPAAPAAPAAKPAAAMAGKPGKQAAVPAGGKQQPQRQQKQQQPQQQQRRPAVNSKAAKATAASQQEQAVQQRKRSADNLIDQLAQGPEGALRQRKKSKKEQTDTVDKLAQQYVKKYFDAPAPKAPKADKAAAAASQRAAMKRWFE